MQNIAGIMQIFSGFSLLVSVLIIQQN